MSKQSAPPSRWGNEQLYFDPASHLQDMLAAVAKARHGIDFEMFILGHDSSGHALLQALKAASLRGVQVRCILDGFGSRQWPNATLTALSSESFQVRLFHPLPRLMGLVHEWRDTLNLLTRLNQRNHRKLMIIDAERAFVGSANIADIFSQWRETCAQVRAGPIDELSMCFEDVWRRCHTLSSHHPQRRRRSRARLRSGLVRSNHALRLRLRHRWSLRQQLRQAQHRIWIETAYFVPSPMLLGSLREAVARGVDVRLILPWRSNMRAVRWVSQLSYSRLHHAGVHIFEYQPNMLHAKTLLIDDMAIIGSTNLNYRSQYHDLELDIVLHQPQSIEALRTQLERDMQHSLRVDQAYLRSRPWRTRIAGWLTSWFQRWM